LLLQIKYQLQLSWEFATFPLSSFNSKFPQAKKIPSRGKSYFYLPIKNLKKSMSNEIFLNKQNETL